MANKVWFCHMKDECVGLYIGHHNRDKAKSIAANEIGCQFTEVHMELIKDARTEHTGILPRSERERLFGATMVEY